MTTCAYCGKEKNNKKTNKFCCPRCYSNSRIGAKRDPEAVRKTAEKKTGKKLTPEQRKRVSLGHMGHPGYWKGKKRPDMSGDLSPFWRGGVTSFNKKERRKFQLTIAGDVLERDNYTCQMCQARGVHLQVDHIQPWAEYVELRFNMDNCRTLCEKCHYKITFGKEMPKEIKAWGRNLQGREIL